MLDLQDIERELRELKRQFEGSMRELEERYHRDKAALEHVREMALCRTKALEHPRAENRRVEMHLKSTLGASRSGHKMRDREKSPPRSKRDTMRAITSQMEGEFTLHDLEAAAERNNLPLAPKLTRMDWSATLWQFYKQGLIDMVQARRGNLPALYRLKTKDLSPPPNKKAKAFPLQELVLEAVNGLPHQLHGKKVIFEQVKRMHPEHAERLNYDSVVATLHRLATFGQIRRENSTKGNLYGRAK